MKIAHEVCTIVSVISHLLTNTFDSGSGTMSRWIEMTNSNGPLTRNSNHSTTRYGH